MMPKIPEFMQYHNYIFLQSEPNLHDLPDVTLQSYKKDMANLLSQSKAVVTYSYATLGLKSNTNILLWFQSETLEEIQNLLNQLLHSHLGRYLRVTYTLFGLSRPTQYSNKSVKYLDTTRKGGKYLIIYPFTKTAEWHSLDFETRRKLMGGHVSVGKKYPQIEQVLLYSYGIDDSEFIVSYETDQLADFQGLVMELRSDKVRAYTLKDTPIFTCIYKPFEEALDYL